MTRTTHEILLVLTVLVSVTSGWTSDGHGREGPWDEGPDAGEDSRVVDIEMGTSLDANTLRQHINRWNESEAAESAAEDVVFYSEDLPDVLFHSSADNDSLILKDLTRCLHDFPFATCLKFLLLSRLDSVLDYIGDNALGRTNFTLMHGLLVFKCAPTVYHGYQRGRYLDLDEDITRKVLQLFSGRALQVNLLPGFSADVIPVPAGGLFGFEVRPYFKWSSWRMDAEAGTGRKKGGFQMPSMMVLPQLIMWGMMPFALANLQAMVMNAFMLNMMALNSAVFMTIRNLIFGPKGGPKIKYVNYGYRNKKKSKVPTLIVHSPAAFVKQPFRKGHRHKPHHRGPPHHGPFPHNQISHGILHDQVVYIDEEHRGPPHHGSPHQQRIPQEIPHEHVAYIDEEPSSFAEVHPSIEQGADAFGKETSHEFYRHAPRDPLRVPQESSQEQYVRVDGDPAAFSHPQSGEEFYSSEDRRRRDERIQVLDEGGHLDGLNRVRIRIKPDGGTSVKEILNRVRVIEGRSRLRDAAAAATAEWTPYHPSTSHIPNGGLSAYAADGNHFRPLRSNPNAST